jgi:uncharacterized protein (DUF1015 family)
MLKVDEASKELESKSYGQIQKETAWKWASRAAASFLSCKKAKKDEKLVFWTVAEEFYHEAIEHAALVESDESLVKEVREAIHSYQEEAAESMGSDPEKTDVI